MGEKLLCAFVGFLVFPRNVFLTLYYPTVFWTPHNCKFKLNERNSEGYYFKVKSMGHMTFACPHLAVLADKTERRSAVSMMHENLLVVDKESYESCQIKNRTQAREILRCDSDPLKVFKYTEEVFSRRQASDDKMCYNPEQDYYFISTSNGSVESLNNTEGGHCKTHNMKLRVYVCGISEPCDYVMPECPSSEMDGNAECNPNGKKTVNTTEVPIATQRSVKLWLSDYHHYIVYAAAGIVVAILTVLVFWLVRRNRKYTHSSTNERGTRSTVDNKLLNDKEAVL